MPELLSNQPLPKVVQKPGPASREKLSDKEALLVVTGRQTPAGLWRSIPGGAQLKKLIKNRKVKGLCAHTRLNNKPETAIFLAQLDPGDVPATSRPDFGLLNTAGQLAAQVSADDPATLTVFVDGFGQDRDATVIRALLSAIYAQHFQLPQYKSAKQPQPRLKQITIVGHPQRLNLARTLAEAQGNNLARWLTALPPNKLDTKSYRRAIKQLASQYGWSHKFLSETQLQKLGAGAFLAVSQANSARDAGIVHLRYRPQGTKLSTRPALALVGKGIIFDTGGTNLKPFKAMLDMHHDMAGSAVALATLTALSEMKFPAAVDCWLAITENRLSNNAYKSRDIVTASNGTTIEIIHTDAEGRMALADTLVLAGREKPKALVDFATLTGTCVAAMTERYSGAFSNREALNSTIIQAGRDSGERVWPFPLDNDFAEDIKSEIADVLQCAPAGGGDHIQAAKFLEMFVPATSNWIHVDLSAASRKGGLAHIPSYVTGFGVRFAISLALDHYDALTTKAKSPT